MKLSRRSIIAVAAGLGGLSLSGPAGLRAQQSGNAIQAAQMGVTPNLSSDQTMAMQRAIDAAVAGNLPLHLEAGTYVVGNLKAGGSLVIKGAGRLTKLVNLSSGTMFSGSNCDRLSLEGIAFDGSGLNMDEEDQSGLIEISSVDDLRIENCAFLNSATNGLSLKKCSGRVSTCRFESAARTALFSLDGRNLALVENLVRDAGDNGIQVWQSSKRPDGSIISRNTIERIAARSGGNGPYGNGINIYRAGNVQVSDNRITDCRFSAVRNNAGANCQITGNNCSRLDEVAIFVEFGFDGAVVSNNLVEQAGQGISITNFDSGGRLAVCSGNLVRAMRGPVSNPDTRALGIEVEADTSVTGNVVEDAAFMGLQIGWGKFMRNVSATGNVIRDCGIGIGASVTTGAGKATIVANIISGSRKQAIAGMDHLSVRTPDLANPANRTPGNLLVANNLKT